MFGNKLGEVDKITIGIDFRTYIGYLDESFYCSNDGNPGGSFLGQSLVYIDGKVFGSDEGIKLISNDGEVFTLVPNMEIPLTTATEQLHLP